MRLWGENLGIDFRERIWGANLGRAFWERIWGANLGKELWEDTLGSEFGEGIWGAFDEQMIVPAVASLVAIDTVAATTLDLELLELPRTSLSSTGPL